MFTVGQMVPTPVHSSSVFPHRHVVDRVKFCMGHIILFQNGLCYWKHGPNFYGSFIGPVF